MGTCQYWQAYWLHLRMHAGRRDCRSGPVYSGNVQALKVRHSGQACRCGCDQAGRVTILAAACPRGVSARRTGWCHHNSGSCMPSSCVRTANRLMASRLRQLHALVVCVHGDQAGRVACAASTRREGQHDADVEQCEVADQKPHAQAHGAKDLWQSRTHVGGMRVRGAW
eukprot:69740-Chlamydomonas_euryale.AAC.2